MPIPGAPRRDLRRACVALAIGLWATACVAPGVRGTGTGRLELGGTFDLRWSGTCVYEVHTRWATALPHVATLAGDGLSFEIATSHGFEPGSFPLVSGDATARRAMLLEGHTVRGAVDGTLDVRQDGTDVVATVTGVIEHRDRGPIVAECRWREN